MSHELNVSEIATGNQRLCSIWQHWSLILQVAAGFSFHTREQLQFISKFAGGKKKSQLVLSANPLYAIMAFLNALQSVSRKAFAQTSFESLSML